MTDTERERINAICEAAHVDEIDDVSDGFHTFRQLYYQRMMLFATIVKQNKDKAWKSLRHEDGELCFGGGWFIVGIDTPEGSYTYHYEDNYYSLFDCEELERGKHWDGHTEKDVTRLLSLPSAQPKERTEERAETHACDCIERQAAIDAVKKNTFRLTFAEEQNCEGHVAWSAEAVYSDVMEGALLELPSAQLGQRYTNEELMIFQHGISLSLLSKRSAQHWQYDENTATEIKFLERLYEKVSANMRGGQNE